MRHLHFAALLLVLALGCESASVKQMRAPSVEPWDALMTFQGEPLMSVAYPKEMGNWNAVKAALTAPQFSEALAAFEQSPLPSGHTDKQAQKDAMIAAWKEAIEAAKSGPQDALKAKVEAALSATSSL